MYVLRFTFYVLRFTFYVCSWTKLHIYKLNISGRFQKMPNTMFCRTLIGQDSRITQALIPIFSSLYLLHYVYHATVTLVAYISSSSWLGKRQLFKTIYFSRPVFNLNLFFEIKPTSLPHQRNHHSSDHNGIYRHFTVL